MTHIFLASSSPRRTQLLQQIGVEHQVIEPECDENVPVSFAPRAVVESLSLRKAKAVAARVKTGIVIGADTIVTVKGQIFGKPRNAEQAYQMLDSLQGSRHQVFSGVAAVAAQTGQVRVGYRKVWVKMRSVSAEEIVSYVQTGEPLDKAGAYSIQGYGAVFVESIVGDYYAVVGLPLELTMRFLRELENNLIDKDDRLE